MLRASQRITARRGVCSQNFSRALPAPAKAMQGLRTAPAMLRLKGVQFDTALNLIWLVLGVLALTSTLRSCRGRAKSAVHPPAWLHVCGVALIVAALFPYISATDDVLRMEHMNAEHAPVHHRSGKRVPSDGLIRLYETMDTPVIGTVHSISLVLCFLSLVVSPVLQGVDRSMPLQSGRSPPLGFA